MTTMPTSYNRAYYQKNKDRIKAQQKAYRERKKAERGNPKLVDTRESMKPEYKEAFQTVPQPTRSEAMEYYYANRERILEQQRARRKKAKANAKQREYYAKNKEHLRELSRINYSKRQREKRLSKSFIGRIVLKVEKFVKGK